MSSKDPCVFYKGRYNYLNRTAVRCDEIQVLYKSALDDEIQVLYISETNSVYVLKRARFILQIKIEFFEWHASAISRDTSGWYVLKEP